MSDLAIAVWYGEPGVSYTDGIHGTPLGKLTMERINQAKLGQPYALVPWLPDLDWLAEEIKTWTNGIRVRRTPPRAIEAMHDLVAATLASCAILVQGSYCVVDRAHIRSAYAKCAMGKPSSDPIDAPVFAQKAWWWLARGESAWVEPKTAAEARTLMPPAGLVSVDCRSIPDRQKAT